MRITAMHPEHQFCFIVDRPFSKKGLFPEICGDAVLLVDPYSVDAIADAMQVVSFDDGLRQALVVREQKQKKLFSWEKTAGLLWQAVERAFP